LGAERSVGVSEMRKLEEMGCLKKRVENISTFGANYETFSKWAVIGRNFDKFRRNGIILNYIKNFNFSPTEKDLLPSLQRISYLF
jgi:hypothetical protein